MSSTLSEGVRVPDIGSTSWGADVNFNWGLLNTALANISGNVKVNVENTWTAPQTFTETISGSIDGVAARAVGDEDGNNIKSALAGKQPSLSQSQLDACNSGVTAAAVQQIGTNASNISGLQTAVASKAADSDVVHLAGAETITGDKTWTGLNTFQYTVCFKDAAAVSAGGYGVGLGFFDYAGNRYGYIQPHVTSDGTKNIVFGNSASGYLEFSSSLLPYASGAVNLGSFTNQWASVYAQSYYYNGTAWGLDKYNQWTEVNDFNNLIGLNDAELWFKHPNIEDITTNPSTNVGKSILQIWNKGTTQYFGGIIDRLMTDGSHELELVCFGYPLNSTTPYQHRFIFAAHRDGGADFYPAYNGVVNLGTSTNKWKTLNGINPGALGLQNFNAGITLDTTNWDKTGEWGANANFWTPTVNGWLTVLVNGTPGSGWVQLSQADNLGQFSVCLSTGYAWATIPVVANGQCKICLLCSTVSAKFFPCLGNV